MHFVLLCRQYALGSMYKMWYNFFHTIRPLKGFSFLNDAVHFPFFLYRVSTTKYYSHEMYVIFILYSLWIVIYIINWNFYSLDCSSCWVWHLSFKVPINDTFVHVYIFTLLKTSTVNIKTLKENLVQVAKELNLTENLKIVWFSWPGQSHMVFPENL